MERFGLESYLTLEHDCGVPTADHSQEAGFTVAAVARRIGVAPGTLRTWSRRYGIGPTGHSEGEHRKYSEEDLARLIYMRKLIISGVSPLDASRKALEHKGRANLDDVALQIERDHELVEQLYRAARGLNSELLETGIRDHLERNGIEATWHALLVPLLFLVGDEWKKNGTGVEVEHLLSEVIFRILNSKITAADSTSSARPVLIASIGDETHCLAITALAAALSERGIPVQFLGARTPKAAINEVVRRSAPAAIFLWAQLRKHADASFITDLPSVRPKPKVIVGGPGWGAKDHAQLHRAEDLTAACTDIERAVGL
jgi:DNA-binding transcriptional MerR regulator